MSVATNDCICLRSGFRAEQSSVRRTPARKLPIADWVAGLDG